MNCYCCSNRKYEDCCAPFLRGAAKPSTAEALMRSRYSAYACAEVEYLLRSTHPSTRRAYDAESIERWAKASRWQKLEIVSTAGGASADKEGTVEFKAHYMDENGQSKIHHEKSNFRKELGKWFFVDGRVL
jgi:SEC-C motif-containing protein